MSTPLPFFQQLTGRNPVRPSHRFPLVRDVKRFPKPNPVIVDALHLRSDAAAELFCNLVNAYPAAKRKALQQGAPVFAAPGTLPPGGVRLKSQLPSGIAVEPIKLPAQPWPSGLFQLEDEWRVRLQPARAEWAIGNSRFLADTWVDGSVRYLTAPLDLPYRFCLTGANAITLPGDIPLAFHAVNPNKDFVALLRYLEGVSALWALPFSQQLRQAVSFGSGDALASPAVLADLAVEAAFMS